MPCWLSPEPCPAQAAVVPARGPFCSLFRATLSESCAAPFGLPGITKRFSAALQRGLRKVGPVSLSPHPRLGIDEQSAHLVEHHPGRRPGRLERLDSLEPREHGARLVHAWTVAGRD